MRFVCRLGTPDGAVLEEIHEGSDMERLRVELQKKGLHVFEIRPRGLPRFAVSSGRSNGANRSTLTSS